MRLDAKSVEIVQISKLNAQYLHSFLIRNISINFDFLYKRVRIQSDSLCNPTIVSISTMFKSGFEFVYFIKSSYFRLIMNLYILSTCLINDIIISKILTICI